MADNYENIDGGTPDGTETSPSGEIGDLLETVYNQLKDEGVEWPPSKLLPYLNLFVLETINLKPECYPVEESVTLVAGSKQSLPTTTIELLGALYNVTGSGTTEVITGSAILMLEKSVIDNLFPGWITSPDDDTVIFIVKDEKNPKVFYTYPPQPSAPGKVKLLLSEPPDEITVDTTEFPFDASYKPAAIDYLIYRALNEETTIPNAQAKADKHYNYYLQKLGLKSTIQKQTAAKGR